MEAFHRNRVSYSGILLFGIIQGLCVLADGDTETVHMAAGSSLILPLGHQKESVLYAEWKFNDHAFATFVKQQIHKTEHHQFKGRVKVNSDGVELEALEVRDSGTFSIVVDGNQKQFPTKTVILKVDAWIDNVDIQTNQTWLDSAKACDVHLWCQANGDESASYTWSGYQNGSGALLHFTFSPAEGDIILNCTAANSLTNKTATKQLTCSPQQPDTNNSAVLMLIGAAGGAALLLLVAVAMAVRWKCRPHTDTRSQDCGPTVYAVVNKTPVAGAECKQSQSNIPVASIYETVDDLRVMSHKDKPQTLYDRVTFSRPSTDWPACPATSLYQDFL